MDSLFHSENKCLLLFQSYCQQQRRWSRKPMFTMSPIPLCRKTSWNQLGNWQTAPWQILSQHQKWQGVCCLLDMNGSHKLIQFGLPVYLVCYDILKPSNVEATRAVHLLYSYIVEPVSSRPLLVKGRLSNSCMLGLAWSFCWHLCNVLDSIIASHWFYFS